MNCFLLFPTFHSHLTTAYITSSFHVLLSLSFLSSLHLSSFCSHLSSCLIPVRVPSFYNPSTLFLFLPSLTPHTHLLFTLDCSPVAAARSREQNPVEALTEKPINPLVPALLSKYPTWKPCSQATFPSSKTMTSA